MDAVLFFIILFSLIYVLLRNIKKCERKNRLRHIQEVPKGGRRSGIAVPKNRNDESAGFLLLTDNLRDDND